MAAAPGGGFPPFNAGVQPRAAGLANRGLRRWTTMPPQTADAGVLLPGVVLPRPRCSRPGLQHRRGTGGAGGALADTGSPPGIGALRPRLSIGMEMPALPGFPPALAFKVGAGSSAQWCRGSSTDAGFLGSHASGRGISFPQSGRCPTAGRQESLQEGQAGAKYPLSGVGAFMASALGLPWAIQTPAAPSSR